MKTLLVSIISLLTLTSQVLGFRATSYISGTEIISRLVERQASRTEVELIKMVLIDEAGNTQQRRLVSIYDNRHDDGPRYLIRFLEPENIRGVAVFMQPNDEGELSQYLYLPGIGQARMVTGNQRGGSFLGSDFSFEDIREENPAEQNYHRMLDDEIEGRKMYVIMAAPNSVDVLNATGYAHRILYIDQETYEIRRIEFFGEGDSSPVKTLEGERFQPADQTESGISRPARITMRQHDSGTTTVMTLEEARVAVDVPLALMDLEQLGTWEDATLGLLESLDNI